MPIPRLLRRVLRAASIAPYSLFALAELVLTQTIEHTIPRRTLGQVGKNSYIAPDVSFRFPKNIRLGDRVTIGTGCRIWASENGSILMRAHVMLGPNVTILTANHRFDDRQTTVHEQVQHEGDVDIGEDVWMAANVVILPGVTIGNGAIIAAGAVVTKNVDPFSIVGGVPARPIGIRGENGSRNPK